MWKWAWSWSGLSYQAAPYGEKEADPFDHPPEDGCLEVFRLCQIAALQDSGRVDDAQTTKELSTWDIAVHDL